MKQVFFLIALLAITAGLFFVSCSKDDETVNATAKVEEKSSSGVTGTVKFTEKDGVVSMKVDVQKLKPGLHGIHIHAIGDCSAADGSSAGLHWNPTNTNHGKWGTGSFHIGDIGNLNAGSDGSATLEMKTDLWCLSCGDPAKNIIGKSIIIHAAPDDFVTQPTGGSGARVGCGIIVLE